MTLSIFLLTTKAMTMVLVVAKILIGHMWRVKTTLQYRQVPETSLRSKAIDLTKIFCQTMMALSHLLLVVMGARLIQVSKSLKVDKSSSNIRNGNKMLNQKS